MQQPCRPTRVPPVITFTAGDKRDTGIYGTRTAYGRRFWRFLLVDHEGIKGDSWRWLPWTTRWTWETVIRSRVWVCPLSGLFLDWSAGIDCTSILLGDLRFRMKYFEVIILSSPMWWSNYLKNIYWESFLSYEINDLNYINAIDKWKFRRYQSTDNTFLLLKFVMLKDLCDLGVSDKESCGALSFLSCLFLGGTWV